MHKRAAPENTPERENEADTKKRESRVSLKPEIDKPYNYSSPI